jgi:hypothetical protein
MSSRSAHHRLHREIGVAGPKAGKPFWIEKPDGRDANEAAEVAAAARKERLVTSVGLQLPPRPAVEQRTLNSCAMREPRPNPQMSAQSSYNSYASDPKGALTWAIHP